MFNEKGFPIDIEGKESNRCLPNTLRCTHYYVEYDETTLFEERARMQEKIESIRTFSNRDQEAICAEAGYSQKSIKFFADPYNKRRILLFVHGGLNTQKGTLERSARLFTAILCEGGYYPIFVNWDSSLDSSYIEHLLNVRQGEHHDLFSLRGLPLAPAFLITDVARGLSRAPLSWAQLFTNAYYGSIFYDASDAREAANDLVLQRRESPGESITISSPQEPPGYTWNTFYSGLTYIVTLPFKLLSAPFLDALGTSSWGNMRRRTHLLFNRDEQFKPDSNVSREAKRRVQEAVRKRGIIPAPYEGATHARSDSGLTRFYRLLEKEVELSDTLQGPLIATYEFTLVGHSAGTIVLNELLRGFPDRVEGKITHIVYMAAACSIREYQESVWPYLERNKKTEFYSLMLHEKAEAQDNWVPPIPIIKQLRLDPAPRGSLLVWIDGFLSNPSTMQDRTLGRYTNIMAAVHNTPVAIRGRINFKVFRLGGEGDPAHHAGFSDRFIFWKPQCWDPNIHNNTLCWETES